MSKKNPILGGEQVGFLAGCVAKMKEMLDATPDIIKSRASELRRTIRKYKVLIAERYKTIMDNSYLRGLGNFYEVSAEFIKKPAVTRDRLRHAINEAIKSLTWLIRTYEIRVPKPA